jgi:signal peptidase II
MRSSLFTRAVYLIALVAFCDQISKWWIVNVAMRPPHVIMVAPFLNFALVWNKGVTFGLLNRIDHGYMPYILIGMGLVIVLLLGRWLLRTTSGLVAFALAGIMGGAISNIIDRFRYGAVVDFLDFYYHGYHWYTFNIADAAIVTGVCLLLLDSFIRGR